MINNPETGALCPFNFEQIVNEVPEIKEFGFDIDSYTLPELIDSSDVKPQVWACLLYTSLSVPIQIRERQLKTERNTKIVINRPTSCFI